jgi:ribosome-associated protein
MRRELYITDHVVIPPGEIAWTAVRSGGPGGQNVNKVASKVEVRFDLAATRALDDGAKARLRALAPLIDKDGRVVVVSQMTRDQGRNLDDALARLAGLIRRALYVPPPRRATRPSRGSKERRLRAKKRHGDNKRERSGSAFHHD